MAGSSAGIGELTERISFQSRPLVDDGMGGLLPGGEFETRFTVWAKLMPLRGGEAVQASRLSGKQPYAIRVWRSSDTRQVNEAWQLVDAHDGSRIFAITAPPTDPDGSRVFLDFLCVEGQAS
jgi:SPP1 family predicted phage head-tail adaptor